MTTMTIVSTLKEPEGLRYYGVAVLYAVFAYALGPAGLFHPAWPVNLILASLIAQFWFTKCRF